MGEHTPTPWHQGERANFRIVSEGDYTIATVGCDSSLRDQWEANAAFIVQAVNCHEMLVKTLEGIAEFYSGDDATLGALSRLAHIRNTALTILGHVGPVGIAGEK